MRFHTARVAAGVLLSLSLVVVAAPAPAQNFQNGSAVTVPSGNVRLTASPVHMFGPDGLPDRTGGAFRFGYGITDSFDVEAKTAFFNGVSLVGVDGHFNVLGGETLLSLTVGGHRAVGSGTDSTALDLAVQLGQRLSRPRRPAGPAPEPAARGLRGAGVLLRVPPGGPGRRLQPLLPGAGSEAGDRRPARPPRRGRARVERQQPALRHGGAGRARAGVGGRPRSGALVGRR